MTAPRIPLVDSHCHLDFPDLADDLPGVVERAAAAGVGRMVTIATSLAREVHARRISEAFPEVFFAAGNHPNRVAEEPMARTEDLVRISAHPKMIGIGESGLDYHYSIEAAGRQQESLRVHIEAARLTDLPLIVHARDADDDLAEILADEYSNAPYSCVMHCFSSSEQLARTALDLGFYLSMSGIVTFRNAEALRAIFAFVPKDRILVETDAPYLAPVPHRGKRNEPAFTAHTAAVGAALHHMPPDEFAALTSRNFDRLFSKAGRWRAAA